MRRLVLALFLCLAGLPAAAQDGFRRIEMAGGRSYLLAAPAGVAHPPLLVALHGGGGSARQFARDSGLGGAALARGYAVAFPEGSSRRGFGLQVWNALSCCGHAPAAGIDDLAFLDAVVADAAARTGAKAGRLYLTGMSNGGMLAETYAARRPGQVRAVASVSGTMDVRRAPVLGPVAMMQIHGTADDVLPYAGGQGDRSITRTDFCAVDQVIAAFRRAAGQPLAARRDLIDPAADGMHVERTRWLTPQGRVQVELLAVVGGGHAWPGGIRAARKRATRDIDATREVLAFFDAQG